MLIFFIFLNRFTITSNSIEFNGKHIQIENGRSILADHNSWYFVKYQNVENPRNFYDHRSYISPEWRKIFLTHQEAEKLKQVAKIQPISVEQKKFDFSENNTLFYAEFHESFHANSDQFVKYKKMWENIYEIETRYVQKVLEIPELIFISDAPINYLHNRWAAGYTQKNQIPDMSKFGYMSPRYMSDHGLTGQNQVISIVDGGLDVNHSFFYDPNHPKFSFDVLNTAHRKIIFYDSYGNQKDSETSGHGTHVAGSAAGNSMCGNELSLYNGAAFDAKIHFIDIRSDDASRSLLNFPVSLLSEEMAATGARVSSNSWGARGNTAQTYLYNTVAKYLEHRLLMFSAGNDGKEGCFTINSPGDCKNVLTCGMLDKIFNQEAESSSSSISLLGNNGKTYSLSQFSGTRYDKITKGVADSPTTKIISDITSDKVYMTTSSETICSITSDKAPVAAIFASSTKPSCKTTAFPVFQTTSVSQEVTEVMSLSSVSIKVAPKGSSYADKINEDSAKGPTYHGLIKPDIVGPGTKILSSDSKKDGAGHGCSVGDLRESTGTSMSTPLLAGNALLAYQYFLDGYYPTGIKTSGNEIDPDANLIRAIMIGSADPVNSNDRAPNLIYGHGLVNMANVFHFDSSLKVLIRQSIKIDEEKVLTFNVNNAGSRQIRIAMAFLDEPTTNDNSPLIIDLDMFLVLPDKSIIYGNMHPGNHEEHFSTCEKIVIDSNKVQNGKYELHIVGGGNIKASFKETAQFSMFVVGPLDGGLSDWTTQTRKVCTFPNVGVNCQIKAIEITNSSSIPLKSCMATYAYFNVPEHYANLTMIISKPTDANSRVFYQLTPNAIPLYAYEYKTTTQSSEALVHINLKNTTYGEHSYLGMRFGNAGPNDYDLYFEYVYDVYVEPIPKPTTPVATMKSPIMIAMIMGYVLFAISLAIMIMFVVLYVKKRNSFRKLGV
ncbi:hypothetical protein TRFO_19413 [Tritrichomonas foetus]|uniref:Peptidase S8/S53 domain-containing protein n=1 Tax=Tritrichomonas foetus TaxID=1144522 RepID=A0A1J4KI14_9EUKA|nr:hypothetical protein TRFO_19413 [Tritrichomonas foetus]|eukprot:OHT11025.1 hypothetical protein TRFO_19413 [Tritrichomonas foetus]